MSMFMTSNPSTGLMSGEPVIERDRRVEEAGPGERRVAAAAEVDEGAQEASVAIGRSPAIVFAHLRVQGVAACVRKGPRAIA